ncbi:hypothetical protein C8N25_101461 [Algoriphagus antarcticus]|uniref:Uncharacterized protein n=1 Tax=Algoriphagus antarcticus TaxID=238540 RepID=A0A3E0E8Q9_9BACT|nr:hypothetical protein C8N25_101461 [Algoriphagus antarcticus]
MIGFSSITLFSEANSAGQDCRTTLRTVYIRHSKKEAQLLTTLQLYG